jgi:hypothetical protein
MTSRTKITETTEEVFTQNLPNSSLAPTALKHVLNQERIVVATA